MSRKLAFVLALLFLSELILLLPARSNGGNSAYMLHTEGAHLVNAQGERVHLHGVSFNNFLDSSTGWFPGGEYYTWDEAAVVNNLETLASWGCNFLGVAVWYDWFYRDANDSLSGPGTTDIGCRDAVKRVVELAYEYGIYVGVGIYGISPGSGPVAQYVLEHSAEYVDFWLTLSNALREYSNVIYAIITEVGENEATMNGYFQVVVQAIQRIRTDGDEHVVMYHEDACGYPIRFNKPATQGGEAIRKLHENASNIVYDAHTYRWHGTFGGNPDYFDPASGSVTNSDGVYAEEDIMDALTYWGYLKILDEYKVPIVMWEGGANNGVSPPNSWEKENTCWQNLLSIFNELDIGYGAFWWRPSGPWALIDGELLPTEWGQTLKNAIAARPPEIRNVSQTPLQGSVRPEDEVKVNATVTDISGVEYVFLNYTCTNSSGTWSQTINMTNVRGDIWHATIPTLPYSTNITYFIVASDEANNTITTEEMGYKYQYEVVPESQLFLVLPIFLTATLMAVVLLKKRKCWRKYAQSSNTRVRCARV